MSGDSSRAIDKALFETASNIEDAEARREFLEMACGGDAARLLRIVDWLGVQNSAETFFRNAAIARVEIGSEVAKSIEGTPPDRLLAADDSEPGSSIGRYRLLELIGKGGCGVVYLAEQLEPVRRRVALKVIRSGLDSAGVIARFESERQTLALMDHPGIARVLDAGATENGRPFVVMELVSGEKITSHCDIQCLDLRQRLELFIQVCQAIQHAHQKGIIHRDIKPSNVLVAMQDGEAVPKVIDFGIARAIEGRRSDETFATAHDQLAGTPTYMSPEQAEGGQDPDTRGDVYSLGVLLYELLTGRTPFDGKRLAQAGLLEMLRILRDEEPPAPSAVLARMPADEIGVVSASRATTPAALIAALRGDLDAIVAKAMAKDRRGRYDTVNGLAMDLRRFLNDEPVSARASGTLDLVRKLWRRHRLAFASAAAVTVALVAGLAVASWFYLREREARQIQASLREAAEVARGNEARLLQQSKARESVSLAAMLLAEGKIEEADALLEKTPLDSIEPSLEATNLFRTLGDWNAIRQRWNAALESLGYSSRPEVATLIDSAFHREDPNWRASALVAMGRSADERWEDEVTSSLISEDERVKRAAAQAAGELGLRSARPVLLRMLAEEDDSDLASAAIWSLSQIGGEDVRTYLESLLDQTEDEDQIEFLEEALDNLAFTEDLDRFDLIALDPDDEVDVLEDIDEEEE